MKLPSLRWRITLGLLAYAAILTAALISAATVLGESRERIVWRALLTEALERDARAAGLIRGEPGEISKVQLIDLDSHDAAKLPDRVRNLAPGLHSGTPIAGQPYAVLVHPVNGHRLAALIDIGRHERAERRLMLDVIGLTSLGLALLLGATWWLAGRLLRPVNELRSGVHALDPMHRGERVRTHYRQQEIVEIETAVNAFLERLDAFVVREREFIDTVSHELRTPIAVIGGAADVLADSVPPGAPGYAALARIRSTVVEVEHTVSAIVYLAKDPTGFATRDSFQLDALLPEIVREHAPLLDGSELEIRLERIEPTELVAPPRIAAIAIGNLLRNAIEHAPAGIVHVSLVDGVVTVADEGAVVDPATISRWYRVQAQSGAARPAGSGIGLYVVARICERLGWLLSFEPRAEGGICGRLDVRASRRGGGPDVTGTIPTS